MSLSLGAMDCGGIPGRGSPGQGRDAEPHSTGSSALGLHSCIALSSEPQGDGSRAGAALEGRGIRTKKMAGFRSSDRVSNRLSNVNQGGQPSSSTLRPSSTGFNASPALFTARSASPERRATSPSRSALNPTRPSDPAARPAASRVPATTASRSGGGASSRSGPSRCSSSTPHAGSNAPSTG
jgi:hypothetical protein